MTPVEHALTSAALMVEVDPAAVPPFVQSLEARVPRMKRLQCLWMVRRLGYQHNEMGAVWGLDQKDVRLWLSYLKAPDFNTLPTLHAFVTMHARRCAKLPIVPAYVHLRRKALIDFCTLVKPTSPLHVAAQSIIIKEA